jgi:hypothetical protein
MDFLLFPEWDIASFFNRCQWALICYVIRFISHMQHRITPVKKGGSASERDIPKCSFSGMRNDALARPPVQATVLGCFETGGDGQSVGVSGATADISRTDEKARKSVAFFVSS